jgi:hypothetical protein
MRNFVRSHPAYKHDSVVSAEINYDLIVAIDEMWVIPRYIDLGLTSRIVSGVSARQRTCFRLTTRGVKRTQDRLGCDRLETQHVLFISLCLSISRVHSKHRIRQSSSGRCHSSFRRIHGSSWGLAEEVSVFQ